MDGNVVSTPHSVAFAHLLAKGHADLGLAQFNRLQEIAAEHKRSGLPPNSFQYLAVGVPAALSLVLAIELALKTVTFQRRGLYPKTHNLEEIFEGLPDEAKEIVARTYEDLYARALPIAVVHVAISFASSNESRDPVAAEDLSSFPDGLEHASRAYVKWRYLYEHLDSSEDTHFHFKSLLAFVEAALFAIESYKGGASVVIETPPSN